MPDLPKDGRSYRIWSVVENLITDNLDQIQNERMRDSYYLIREWLSQLRGERITDAEFDYFVENYEYYRDDFWPRIEKKHGIRRPATKPPTVVIERGDEYTEARINEAWDRVRGFIFVEKSGMGEDLKLLSHHGWLITSGQGESTRTFREKAANDGTNRPILTVTDADFYGGGITESIEGHSNRTEHLDLASKLEHRVDEIGLDTTDAEALDLPKERDPTQSPDEWRTELNALTVLKEREGIENPLLSYVIAKMDQLDIPLCPLPHEDREERLRGALRSHLEDRLASALDDAIDEALDGFNAEDDVPTRGDGEEFITLAHMSGSESSALDVGEFADELESAAIDRRDAMVWWHQSRHEEKVRDEAGRSGVTFVEERL